MTAPGNYKRCLLCNPKNDTLYFHLGDELPWIYCNKCGKGYSLRRYCTLAGITIQEFLRWDIDFTESKPNEVRKMEWPAWYLPLFDPRAKEGIEYLASRHLDPQDDVFYDFDQKGIVLPYYFGSVFVGSQTRYLVPRQNADGDTQKIDTLPGTRLGLLFWHYAQNGMLGDVNTIVVTEGAFNAMALEQSFKKVLKASGRPNRFKFMATSGCNLTDHQADVLKEFKDNGMKVVLAYDADEPGLVGLHKAQKKECITHYSLTLDDEKDWNNFLEEEGSDNLVKTFLRNIKNV